MKIRFRFAYLIAASALAALLCSTAFAQPRPQQQVIDLNRQAMEAYNNLEIDQARQLLEQAEQLATQNHVTGAPLARTYLNLGVIQIGGLSENAEGLRYFTLALRADSTIQLDPLTSTPEIQLVYARARNEVGASTQTTPPPSNEPPPSNIPHEAAAEQLVQTPVPVFLEVPPRQRISEVNLFYRGHGMRAYRQVSMERMRGGYGFEIPCHDVFEPAVYYYIEVIARNGDRVAFVGNEERPVTVPVVTTRNHPPPSLPGQAPPQQCAQTDECPPGMPGCASEHGEAAAGEACERGSDCQEGLACEANACVATGEEPPPAASDAVAPRFFANVGLSIVSAYAHTGMLADAAPETSSMAWEVGGSPNCPQDPSQYCVRVANPGFVPSFGLNAAVGYYVLPRLALAATFRFAFSSGVGTLANVMFGARAQYAILTPRPTGLHLDVFAGGGYGQIQVSPPGNGNPAPWIISGLGSANAGAVIGYRITRNVGVQASLGAVFLLPTTMFAIDTTFGASISF